MLGLSTCVHNISRVPNTCGVIYGIRCKLYHKPPQLFILSDYCYRHDVYSILLQGVCVFENIIWNVCIGAPRGTYDATHFMQSSFYKKITRKILQVYVVTIGGQQIILYVINYSIYPILNHIQKPFKEQHELFIKMHMTRT